MTGEAENGNFTYETRPLAGAEYTITAAEDIYTQDRQLDNYGSRTLWYAKGDVVAVVTTGDGTADTAVFAPARTAATYDFLSVIHDGTIGEVSVTLPLGSYHIAETQPPYGYAGTDAAFDVTLAWDNQTQEIVVADAVEFHNEREKAKVGIYKTDLESGKYLAGAVFNLYTADDIYDADGSLVFAAGELVATSPETNADGTTYFDCDIPIRGEQYGSSTHKDAVTNSGKYIVKELRAPLGYYVNEEPMEVTFTYDGEAVQVLESTCTDKPTEMWVSKRDLTNDEELPGATLTIQDMDGNIVESWVSTNTPHRVTGLHLGDAYTLTETRPADGYALADDITFRLLQKADEDGSNLQEAEVYYLTTKNFLFWTWDDWKLLDDATVIMRDDITKVQISKVDPVMQTPADPNYYLKHDFEKNYTDYGCPFMQADCDALAPSDNLILYGHNMKDGSMFADLAKYRSKNFWQAHKTVRFDTSAGGSAYEIFAVIHMTVQADAADAFPFYRFVDAASPEEFADYVSACKARALYDTGISAQYGDKLLTLSTCDNITDNGRLLVIAKQTETE